MKVHSSRYFNWAGSGVTYTDQLTNARFERRRSEGQKGGKEIEQDTEERQSRGDRHPCHTFSSTQKPCGKLPCQADVWAEAKVNTVNSIKLIRQYLCQDWVKFPSIFLCNPTVTKKKNTHYFEIAQGRSYISVLSLHREMLNSKTQHKHYYEPATWDSLHCWCWTQHLALPQLWETIKSCMSEFLNREFQHHNSNITDFMSQTRDVFKTNETKTEDNNRYCCWCRRADLSFPDLADMTSDPAYKQRCTPIHNSQRRY